MSCFAFNKASYAQAVINTNVVGKRHNKETTKKMLDEEFCGRLEYAISEALTKSVDIDWRRCWRDGVLLPDNELDYSPKQIRFSYETLVGHVERGESTFTIEQGERELIFKIRTFSEPGNLLTKLAGPLFTVPYQAYCTRSALEHVRKQMLQGGNTTDIKT